MTAAACPDSQALQQFLLGQMGESKSARVEAHLAACGRCLEAARHLNPPDSLVALAQAAARGPGPIRAEVDLGLIEGLARLLALEDKARRPLPPESEEGVGGQGSTGSGPTAEP